ncbi:hypothetical protein H4582DRAFT_2010159, partial [Lactarius indigo]
YDEAHNVLPTHAQETNLRRFSAGAISSIISVSFTYPLELLRVRMAFQTIYSPTSGCPTQLSFLRTTCLIYSEGVPLKSTGAPITRDPFRTLPLLKFYRGFTASLVGIVPYAAPSCGTTSGPWHWCSIGRRGADNLLSIRGRSPAHAGRWADEAWAVVAWGRDGACDVGTGWTKGVLCRVGDWIPEDHPG